MVQLFDGTQWVDWKKAYLQSLVYFNEDKNYNATDFGELKTYQETNTLVFFQGGTFSIDSDKIAYSALGVCKANQANQFICYYFQNDSFTDLSKYQLLEFSGSITGSTSSKVELYLVKNDNTTVSLGSFAIGNYDKRTISITNYNGLYKLKIRLCAYSANANSGGNVVFNLTDLHFS